MVLDNMLFKQLLKHSFNIPVEVTYPNGKVEQYGGLKPEVKIKINEKISLKTLTENASIALGEAYMDGKIEVERYDCVNWITFVLSLSNIVPNSSNNVWLFSLVKIA